MSAVLRHVAKYRTHWIADFVAEAGRYCVGRGIVNGSCYEYGKSPHPDKVYDAVVEICLYDTWANFHDRPNTRVSSCLHERFGLPWDAECGRYVVNVSQEAQDWASMRVSPKSVAIHYQGDSSKAKKDLTHDQAASIVKHVLTLGHVPYILGRHIPNGHDAEVNCAIIRQCTAFVGIDSGPGKCASSTNTPALITWTGHHPAPFHDPASNTTHLVPRGYHGLEPVCDDRGVINFFEQHYNVRQYDDGDPVREIEAWLTEVLK